MTQGPNALSVGRAIDIIDAATRFEEPFRRRTEGLTWMAWGIVTLGFLLSFLAMFQQASIRALVDLSSPIPSGTQTIVRTYEPGLEMYLLAVLWILLGLAVTHVLWRVAALVQPLGRVFWQRALAVCLFAFFVLAGVGIMAWLLPPARSPGAIFAGLGLAWYALGLLNLHGATALGRRVTMIIGVAMFVAALGVTYALPGIAGDPSDVFVRLTNLLLAGSVVTGGVPIVAGLWQALRG
ncbi:MAG TPA: hypothetical protein VM681_09415 [Candidatus Thermoplasmatota archaeon]|nr:hypothetical protein [Candidatus Thermoplasmatota archaeon]